MVPRKLIYILLMIPVAVLAQTPDEDAVRASLESAATLLQAGRPQEAIEALTNAESKEPDNPWLWYYRGSAQLQLGAPYKAIESYDHALGVLKELGDPDPSLAEQIRLARRRAQRQVFSLSVQMGFAYDTNVTYGGAGGESLGIVSGESDGKFSSGFQLSYAPIADEVQTLAVGARLSSTWQFKVHDFNYQDYGGTIRYARKLGDSLEASLRYDYDLTFLGNEPFLSNHAVSPGLTYRWRTPDFPIVPYETSVFYTFQGQDYLYYTLPVLNRDGVSNGVGAGQSFKVRPIPDADWVMDWAFGYRFDGYHTDGREYDRNASIFSVDVEFPLLRSLSPRQYLILPDKPLTFHCNATWEIDDYWNGSALDRYRRDRRDNFASYAFILSQKLMESPEYGELTLHGILYFLDANSSLETGRGSPFTYNKSVYGLQLEWTW